MANKYSKEAQGFRFIFGGMKLNSVADSITPDKYPVAINIRGTGDKSVQTRPGQQLKFTTSNGFPITDLSTFTSPYFFQPPNFTPRIIARDNQDVLWDDSGNIIFAMPSTNKYLGCSMIPFRPAASPAPYMYVANGTAYVKLSAPDQVDIIGAIKVGIAEPQSPPDAAIFQQSVFPYSANPGWTHGGTAAIAVNATRLADVAGRVLNDPTPSSNLSTVQVSGSVQYQREALLNINGSGFIVQDIFPAGPSPLTISSIFYFSGISGRCIIVPANMAAGPGDSETSIFTQNLLSSLRRGAMITFGGGDFCYVWSVTVGPDGTVAIETSTPNPHTSADTFTILPAIQVLGTPTAFTAITDLAVSYAVTVGIGTQTALLNINPFVNSGFSFQPDDLFSMGFLIDNLSNLTEMKILIDVGDGSFTKNFYYYTIRPSDIAQAVLNTATQVAAVQILAQRSIIDAEKAIATGNQQAAYSSAQFSPGSQQWCQIFFNISQFTRVGTDESKSLQTANHIQILWNANATINVQTGSFHVIGGYQPDVGDTNPPYRYLVRPRASSTGVIGNPSPPTRYGVNPRRTNVLVSLPSALYDSQIDTWDIFRYGGAVTSFRYIGSAPSNAAFFIDNFTDAAAQAGDVIDYDNFEPWPSIDTPLISFTIKVTGTVAQVVIPAPTNALRWLPGTLVQLAGKNVYTLRKRPTLISGSIYLLEFIENASAAGTVTVNIPEPALANQMVPFMWGPDVNGTVFAVGDILRPGTLYFSKSFFPDSAPEKYNLELCPPSEPLLGGEVLDGLSFVASSERWWALYPQLDNPAQRYNFVQQPITRGLASPWGHCNDGVSIYFWAKDGIYSSSQGSLTNDDLYNLFPHEGVEGKDVTYNGITFKAPNYSIVGAFRLTYSNGFIYAVYLDNLLAYHTIVYDLRRKAWSEDIYSPLVTCFFHPQQAAGGSTALEVSRQDELLMGNMLGQVALQKDRVNDLGGSIPCTISTFEFDGGEVRGNDQWGDLFIDCIPAAAGVILTVTPMSQGTQVSPPRTLGTNLSRVRIPLSLDGGVLTDFLGAFCQWTDNFSLQSIPTKLYLWQPSFINKPESIIDRFTDWDDAGSPSAKWWQGFILHADTGGSPKSVIVRDNDTLTTHSFTPVVNHLGESEKAYSFDVPFIAHMVRLEPANDGLEWRLWDAAWVTEPTPEVAETWQTQATTHGLNGYMHVRQISITYAATAPVTLTIGVYDGTPPAAITLPSTGGLVKKLVFVPTFNKGQLFTYKFSSTVPFQVYQDKCEVAVGQWSRPDGYINRPLVGSSGGDEAKI